MLVDPKWLQKARAEGALYTFSLCFPKEKAYTDTTTTSDLNVLKNRSAEWFKTPTQVGGASPGPPLAVVWNWCPGELSLLEATSPSSRAGCAAAPNVPSIPFLFSSSAVWEGCEG